MNILRIFGIVVAIHAFALLLIFANPGCSSSRGAASTASAATDAPVPKADAAPVISVPTIAAADTAPISAPSQGSLYSPTRPGTPAAAALESQPVSDVTPAAAYTVGRGDSLWSIAKKNHLRVSELAAANSLKAGATLHLGQKLVIPSKALPASGDSAMRSGNSRADSSASATAVATPAHASHLASGKATGETTKYTVKPGETLGAIAHKFKVRTGELATLNSISDPQKIRPGQELLIPAGHGASGTSARTSSKSAPAPSAASAPAPSAPAASATPEIGPPAQPEIPVIKIDGGGDTSSSSAQPK